MKRILPLGFAWLLFAGAAAPTFPGVVADDLMPLTEGKPYLHVMHEGRSVRVQRSQDPQFELHGYYAKTARKCPPFCIHPMSAAPGVLTIGEVELFELMEGALRDGTGLLIDARTPAWYKKGTIPGALSHPFTHFIHPPGDPEWDEILPGLGARPSQQPGLVAKDPFRSGKWDCNGPACDQSPRMINGLLAVGYPPGKLLYYRGGMQIWELWGLTTVVPEE